MFVLASSSDRAVAALPHHDITKDRLLPRLQKAREEKTVGHNSYNDLWITAHGE
jgi:hypothetical protein